MSALAEQIRAALRDAADPDRAPAMAAYMRSAETGNLTFLGVRRPEVRRIVRDAIRAEVADATALPGVVRDLWEKAEFREERYAAQDLLALRWARARLDLLDLHRQMALTGAWWDHVDEVAHRVSDLAEAHPNAVAGALRGWSRDPSLWLRRLAILGQLGRRERADLSLLAEVIEPNLADPDFFIRKAIGWALRDAARHHPGWVRVFVDSHDLSPLSRREALKHL